MHERFTRRDALGTFAVGLIGCLAGCSAVGGGAGDHDEQPWPQYGGGPGRVASTDGLDGRPELAWRYALDDRATAQPVVTRDGPVVTDLWHTHAVDEDGERRWRVEHAEPAGQGVVRGTLALLDDTVAVPFAGGLHTRSLDDGSVGWTTDVDAQRHEVLVTEDGCYLTTEDTRYRFDAASGAVRAERANREPRVHSLAGGSDTLVAARTYREVGAEPVPRGAVVGLDPDDLSKTWEVGFDGPTRVGTPTVVDGVVYLPTANRNTGDGMVVAVDVADESVLWTAPVERPGDSVAVSDATAFVCTQDRVVVALDTTSGERRWRSEIAAVTGQPVQGSPLAAGDVVVALVRDLGLVAFDATTGEVRWTLQLDTDRASPVAAGNRVYVAEDALYAIDVS